MNFGFGGGNRCLSGRLVRSVLGCTRARSSVRFRFAAARVRCIKLGCRCLPGRRASGVGVSQCASPRRLLNMLSSMSIFIASVLRLKLAKLATKAPFVDCQKPNGTGSFLHSVNNR